MKKGKIYLLSMLLLGGVATAGAQSQPEADWVKEAVAAKQSFQTEMRCSRMPVVSEWMKLGQKPTRLTADLTGKQELILITDGGPDGSSYDHAAGLTHAFIRQTVPSYGSMTSSLRWVVPAGARR